MRLFLCKNILRKRLNFVLLKVLDLKLNSSEI